MKTIILIEDNRTQLVLKADTEHDKEVLNLLEKLPNTHRCEFWDTQGGFTMGRMAYGTVGGRSSDEDLLIVFDEKPTKENK